MQHTRVGAAIAVAAIASACAGPSPTGQATPAPSPVQSTPATTPVATPAASPSPAATATLVIAPSPDGKHTLIQSFADPTRPVTLYSLNLTANNVKFISATEIGYTTNSSPNSPIDGVTTIWRMRLKDKKPVNVARLRGDALDVAWSPDGTNVAFIAYPNVNQLAVNRLWLKVGKASPRALTPSIRLDGRGTTTTDEVTVRFSPDGIYLLMVDTYVGGRAPTSRDQAHFQMRSARDGRLVWVPANVLKGSWTTMAAWSHLADRLYYDDPISATAPPPGVQWWDASAQGGGTLAKGLAWYSPSISPDDRLVAYHVESVTDGKPHVEVRDLVTGSVRVLPGAFGKPLLLSDEVMLEAQFVPNTEGFGPAYLPSGKYFELNLRTNVHTPLPARFRPLDVWPH